MEMKNVLLKEFELKNDGQIEGYASTFGNIDSVGDVVVAGAFKKSLRKRVPKMFWQHDARQIPGVWETAKEDDSGLYVKGRFVDTALGKEARILAKEGAVDGISIGYAIVTHEYDNKKNIRYLKEVDLFEASLVTFPSNEKARVVTVKSLPESIRDFEGFLRDAGYSREMAKAIAAQGFKALDSQRDAGEQELLDNLQKLINKLKS